MYITDVKLHHFGTGIAQSSLRAYAGMNLDNFVFIKYLRVLIWKSGDLFVGMSSKKRKERKYYDQVEFKKNASILRDRILETYKELS